MAKAVKPELPELIALTDGNQYAYALGACEALIRHIYDRLLVAQDDQLKSELRAVASDTLGAIQATFESINDQIATGQYRIRDAGIYPTERGRAALSKSEDA